MRAVLRTQNSCSEPFSGSSFESARRAGRSNYVGMASRKDLIEMKRRAGRAHDLEHISALEELDRDG